MPGLATALQHMSALELRSDGSNVVSDFSHGLVNTLPKERTGERVLDSAARALQLKQQRHSALLACLASADVLRSRSAQVCCDLVCYTMYAARPRAICKLMCAAASAETCSSDWAHSTHQYQSVRLLRRGSCSILAPQRWPSVQGSTDDSALPRKAVQALFAHAEHLAAVISLHTALAAAMADTQQAAAMEEVFGVVLQRIGACSPLAASMLHCVVFK